MQFRSYVESVGVTYQPIYETKRLVFHPSPRDGHVIIVSRCLILTAVNLIILIRMGNITDRLVSSRGRFIVTFDIGLHEVYGWAGVLYVITKFSRMDSLPKFVNDWCSAARASRARAPLKIAINRDSTDDSTCVLKAMYEAVFFHSDLSSDSMLVPHTLINLTGEKIRHMQKDLQGRSERSETDHSNMAALEREDERLDPSTRVLTVFRLNREKEQKQDLFFPYNDL